MRLIKGHVEILGLGNLLQQLSMNRREGILTLQRGPEKKAIHFTPNGMRLLSSNMKKVTKLGKILLRRRRLTREDLDSLLKEQRLLGWKLGQVAVESGLVHKRDIEEALHEQIEEEIFDLFMWEDAVFEFLEGKAPSDASGHPLSGLILEANMTTLLLEAARRADELLMIRKFLHDEEMTLARLPFDIQADELGPDVDAIDAVLPLINGRRSVREVVQVSIFPRYATLRALHRLVVLGYVKVIDRKGHTVRITVPARPTKS
jgi:hypothetical protein